LYRAWALKLPVTMRQDHVAGEKLFVDCAGDTVTVVVDKLLGNAASPPGSLQCSGHRALHSHMLGAEHFPTGFSATYFA